MNLKRTLLPLYAIVTLFAFAPNACIIAMEGDKKNTAEYEPTQSSEAKKNPSKASQIKQDVQALQHKQNELSATLEKQSKTIDALNARGNNNQVAITTAELQQLQQQIQQQIALLQQNNVASQAQIDEHLRQINEQQMQIDTLTKTKQDAPKIRKNGELNFDFKKVFSKPLNIALASLIIPFFRLANKDVPSENPMDFTTGAKGLVTINPLTKKYYVNAWRFIDDCLIGFKGQKRGFFQVGTSRIGYDGQKATAKEITRTVANSTAKETVTYSTYGNAYPYGLMGTVVAYFLGTGKANDLKDGIANAEWAVKQINK